MDPANPRDSRWDSGRVDRDGRGFADDSHPDLGVRDPRDHRGRYRPDLRVHHQDVRRRPGTASWTTSTWSWPSGLPSARCRSVDGHLRALQPVWRQRLQLAPRRDRLHADPGRYRRFDPHIRLHPGLLDATKLPTDGPLNRNHKILALGIGIVSASCWASPRSGRSVLRHGHGHDVSALDPQGGRHRHLPRGNGHPGRSARHHPSGHPDFSVVGAILIGSIPGILIGSHFTARMNQKVLRSSIATVLAASGLKLLGAW